MTTRIEEMKTEAHEALEKIRTLRDELRVQLHLGGMDAKQRWDKLEEDFKRVQLAAKDASETSLHALRVALEDFKQALEASRRS
ncbi:MAG TPA: hypothetical protein VHO25_23455 [Polyangiaceae bacterium]|nr:hypothetical protein [Polyangiaceae bacterium]